MIIQLREYQPPTRRDELVALSLLMNDVDEPWVVHHVAARLNRMAGEVTAASDNHTADILEFPARQHSDGRFVEAIENLNSVWWRREVSQAPRPTLSVDELFSRVVENRKLQSGAIPRPDRMEAVRAKALDLHAARRKRPAKKPDINEFRAVVLDTALSPDLQRLEQDMRTASADRPWIQKRAGKRAKLPDDGSIDRVIARINERPQKPRRDPSKSTQQIPTKTCKKATHENGQV